MLHPSLSLPALGFGEASAILGEPAYSVTPIGQGTRSRVYRVEAEDGAVRIVRLTPKGSGRVEREAWVRTKLRRNADAPVPAEVAVTSLDLCSAADVVQMAELPGTTMFAAARTMFEPEVRALYAQFGAGLAAIHAVPVDGFGLVDAAGRGRHATWRAAFSEIAAAALEEARVSPLAPLASAAEEVLTRLAPALDTIGASALLHGDAQPMNVQVHRGKLVAFFDFEFATGGDPAYELAYVEPLFEPSQAAANATPADLTARRVAFYEGYARVRPDAPLADPVCTRLYRLVHALRGTEFLSVVGPQLAAPARDQATHGMRTGLERWLAD